MLTTRVQIVVAASMTEQYKQALVARRDLDLSRGKLAAQAAHASERAIHAATDEAYEDWWATSGTKIVLAADDEQHLKQLRDSADDKDIPAALIRDAGRTEIESGTATVLGIGPAPADVVDAVTGNLSLY